MIRFILILVSVFLLVPFAALGCGDSGRHGARASIVPARVDRHASSPAPVAQPMLTSTISPSAVAEPVVEPALPSMPEPTAGVLGVKRLVTARGVEQREPVEAGSAFVENDGPIYAFLELANAGEPTQVTVEWQLAGGSEIRGLVTLDVGASPRWRTWALTRTLYAGSWDCIVRDLDGNELSRSTVTVDKTISD